MTDSISGIISAHNGNESDTNLWDFLKKWSKDDNNRIWLIRFAFPQIPRDQVINEVHPIDNYEKNPDFISLFKKMRKK